MISTAVLTFIGGLITSLIPNLMKMWEKRQDHRHEIEILKIRLEAMARGIDAQERLAVINDADSARRHDASIPYSSFAQGLRSAVRPVITFSLFGMYCAVKIILMTTMIYAGVDPTAIMGTVWGSEDISLFGVVVGFWFGQRGCDYVSDRVKDRNK